MDKYDDLKIKYDKLLYDYSENTIIQSMNDMQKVNKSQEEKIDKLLNIIDKLTDNNKCVKIMLNTVSKNNSNLNLKNRLDFIQDIIINSIKIKSEVYYL
jgi:hypothetical protein